MNIQIFFSRIGSTVKKECAIFLTHKKTCKYCFVFNHVELSASASFILQAAQGGGHRTLLYGHAILLRHSFSGMVRQMEGWREERATE